MLDEDMQRVIAEQQLGYVASVCSGLQRAGAAPG